MNTNRLYLVRHGESLSNATSEFSRTQVNSSLTPRGILQARATAEYLKTRVAHEIYSSPLKRAMDTAEIIANHLNLRVVVMENFREINVGELEGHLVSPENWALHDRIVEDWFSGKPEVAFPDGEDYLTLWDRMRKGIEQIVAHKSGCNIVIVGHAGIFATTLRNLCQGIDVHLLRKSYVPNCSIAELTIAVHERRLRGSLISWASVAHLDDSSA